MSNDATNSSNALNGRLKRPDLVQQLVRFSRELEYQDLPDEVRKTASLFMMDTMAVGVAATSYHATDKALAAAKVWGESEQSRVIGRPEVKLSSAAAAFVNGMQVHALEWDGLHEDTVVIALCATIGALLAEVDRTKVSGDELITAFVVGVEVAVFFGGASTSSPRFFRPSAAGGLGAAVALAKLRNLDEDQTIAALGLAYSQACGTMQAHWEGSMALPMQVGAVARNAHFAVDMALAGMTGPVDIIGGQFNYFELFENSTFEEQLMDQLGQPFKIAQIAHKPYPAGRATQTVLTMLREWTDAEAFQVDEIAKITIYVPPLIMLLVGRPIEVGMTASYARLCLRFIVPLMLIDRDIDPRRFTEDVYSDAAIRSLSEKIVIEGDGNPDKNALGPQSMSVTLNDGRVLSLSCEDPLGSPNNPLNEIQRNYKVKKCFELGLIDKDPENLISQCESLQTLNDCSELLSLVC